MFQSFSPFGQVQGLGSLLQGQMFLPPQQQFFPSPPRSIPRAAQSAVQAPVIVPIVVVVNGTFTFTQATPASSWTIDYPFVGQFPSVTVVDTTGKVVVGDVQFITGLDRVVISFAAPVAGKAFLNA